MGAIVVSIFVTVVAIVGVVYFNYQDKKKPQNTGLPACLNLATVSFACADPMVEACKILR